MKQYRIIYMDAFSSEPFSGNSHTAVPEAEGLNSSDFHTGVPIQVMSTGAPFLVAPVQGMAILKRLRLNRSLLRPVLKPLGVDAFYLFCLEGYSQNADAFGRLLTSDSRIEDPFTGSAVGCMGACIGKYRLLSGSVFKVEQGHLLGRLGIGTAEIIRSNTDIEIVRVGGSAVKTMAGHILVDHQVS